MIKLDYYKATPLRELPDGLRWDLSPERHRGATRTEVFYADHPTRPTPATKGAIYMRVWNHANGVISYFVLTPRYK